MTLSIEGGAMKLHVHFHLNYCSSLLEAIMATQQELVQRVRNIEANVAKIGTETTTLITKVDDLTKQVDAMKDADPALVAAVEAVEAQAKVVDDLVADVAPPPTPTPTPEPPTP
jgi:hypothetical protein